MPLSETPRTEGSYAFWGAVFDSVRRCGRKVEIDLHAKGIDQNMIDLALATGLPVKVSPKFWAEHMGMPYHQADIRDQAETCRTSWHAVIHLAFVSPVTGPLKPPQELNTSGNVFPAP
jgi:hypothetical protein